jgi:CRP-like cAMP-binding protein
MIMKKILLIEDNEEVRENTAEILELSGYKVITAGDGKAGIASALKELPDLVICDIMMPLLDGYGVLHALGKHPETAGIPFIFLTAKSEKTDFRKGMELGADDYLTKPFDGSELLSAVEARLKRAEGRQQQYLHSLTELNDIISHASDQKKIQLTSDEREVNQYRKKHMLYAEGQRPQYIYFLSTGKVKEYRVHDDGKEFISSIYVPGDFFGFTPVIEEKNHTSNAQVLEDATVMLIPAEDFLQLLNNDPQVAARFIKLLARHVADKETHLVNMAYNSLRKKVANGLLRVADKFRKENQDKVVLDISRETLAQVIGSATESLIRTLGDFRLEKLIETEDGKIIILDEKKLRALLN